MIEKARRERREVGEEVRWSSTDPSSLEVIIGNPLLGRSADVLGVIFVGNSRRELIELARFIQATALLAAAIGIGLGVLVSWWAAARVTQPVQELVTGARQVAAGDWSVRVAATGGGEIGELGRAFNRMTGQLAETRERLVQSERVAAWRELARRLAHELKNPLHPLQITIENLERARTQHPEQFEEVFRESTRTLLTELGNLKGIVGRFSDFAKMPAPQPEPVNVNEVVRSVLRLFDAQLNATSAPNVTPEIYLEEHLPVIQADPSQVQRALQNLVLNALDAMPEGGKLTIRTRANGTSVRLEVSDTGAGLTKEECERLFTPYYTTKHQGTGLGLAIVQSVVSDHGGKISVESEPGAGTTFRIELPEGPPEPVLHSTTEN
ncbi:MAG: HAMP domain-containing protein [Acidobacteria bacterium]|nr:HAMP domain-containing protein [Acidobacteriota bacterium]